MKTAHEAKPKKKKRRRKEKGRVERGERALTAGSERAVFPLTSECITAPA